MSLILPSRRLVPAWVRNDLWRRARAVPGMDLWLADNKSLIDVISGQNLITFTRASSGTYGDSQGVLQTAATNEPRFDHDPVTGASLGLLIEEQRTNSIRNNTMQGAVVGPTGTPPINWVVASISNGLNRQVTGVGTQAGIAYIDLRYFGTASATTSTIILPESTTAITAANGQTWAASSWLALTGGSASGLTITQRLAGRSAAGGFLESADTPVALTSTLTRYAASRTFSNASTARVTNDIALSYNSGATIDVTLRIGLPQLEQGASATSVIPTSNAAATRNADVADIVQQALAAGIRTLYAEFRSPAVGAGGVVSLNDNTANERAAINTSGTDPRLVVVDGGVTQADIDAGTIVANTRSRMAVRISADNFAASFNGGAVVTDTSGTLPTVDRLFIGRTQAGEYLNAPIARLVGWREELPDSILQALTQS